MNTVGQLATGIWEDLSQPTDPSVLYISGWLESSRGLGKLNISLNTCFSVDPDGLHAGETYNDGYGYSGVYQAGDFYPALGNTESAIYTEIYKADFYDKKIRDVLNGVIESSDGGNDWTEFREGDSVVKRSNKSELLKTYRGLAGDSRLTLGRLIAMYKKNLAQPRQVAGDDAAS